MQSLIERYYGGSPVKLLLQEFDVQCRPSDLFTFFPPQDLHAPCPACGGRWARARQSRESVRARLYRSAICHCLDCQHVDSPHCGCSHCQSAKEEQRRSDAEAFDSAVAEFCSPFQVVRKDLRGIEELGLWDATALLTLYRATTEVAPGVRTAIIDCPIRFAPTYDFGQLILMSLVDRGYLAPDPDSPPGAFSLQHGELDLDATRLWWRVLVPNLNEIVAEIERASIGGSLPNQWHLQAAETHLFLAEAECVAYFSLCAAERGIPDVRPPRLRDLIANLLVDLSVSQAYRPIWMAARTTADFMVRERPPRSRAGNYMVTCAQSWIDRARAEHWDIKPFRRRFELPQSLVGQVLYDAILGIGDRGFTSPVGALFSIT